MSPAAERRALAEARDAVIVAAKLWAVARRNLDATGNLRAFRPMAYFDAISTDAKATQEVLSRVDHLTTLENGAPQE